MINALKLSLRIDFNYAVNSFIYMIKKTPILRNIITSNLYEKDGFKTFIRILGVICTSIRLLLFRGFYFIIIYNISRLIHHNTSQTFFHIFFIFSIMGMFINTSILSTSRKKNISILLFKMDAKKFILSHYYFSLIIDFILNNIFLLMILSMLKVPISISIFLSLFSLLSKNTGEALSVWYYQKNNQKLLTEKIYFLIIILGLLISLLPIVDIIFSYRIILLFTLIFGITATPSFIYLLKVNNYKMIYKKINALSFQMQQINTEQSVRQFMVDLRDQDREINPKKLKGKKGYDLFNTIFFERHRYLLLRSSKLFAIVSATLIVITIIIIIEYPKDQLLIYNFLKEHISFLILLMYFINRGEIVTQAMFFNCDHAMLTFNLYKNPKVILELFKRRVNTLIKINLIPAIVIAIGFPLILSLTGRVAVLECICIFTLVIFVSIFFSVHYLVIYYLLQPYSREMKIKSPTYSLVNVATYFCCYMLTKIHFNSILFCITVIFFTILYVFISLRLIYKKSPTTFKIK
ncbi:MAG: hypothetical protein HFJ12_01225 [Bacilli bacterium]|nr:hypothetical protein [Bacilli bacterium]